MSCEVDFLAVAENGGSGDAIALRFGKPPLKSDDASNSIFALASHGEQIDVGGNQNRGGGVAVNVRTGTSMAGRVGWSPLTRLKGGNAQAFHYWYQAQRILTGGLMPEGNKTAKDSSK